MLIAAAVPWLAKCLSLAAFVALFWVLPWHLWRRAMMRWAQREGWEIIAYRAEPWCSVLWCLLWGTAFRVTIRDPHGRVWRGRISVSLLARLFGDGGVYIEGLEPYDADPGESPPA